MRCIDADALEKEGWRLHRTIRVDKHTDEYQTKPLKQVPTIEPERKKGKWIDYHTTCSECGWQMIDDVIESPNMVAFNFCPNCGADMRGDADEND
jgi:ribosomal protein L32